MVEKERGFRHFVLDPKSTVMSYLAENMPNPQAQLGGSQSNGAFQQPNGQYAQAPPQSMGQMGQDFQKLDLSPYGQHQANTSSSHPMYGSHLPSMQIGGNQQNFPGHQSSPSFTPGASPSPQQSELHQPNTSNFQQQSGANQSGFPPRPASQQSQLPSSSFGQSLAPGNKLFQPNSPQQHNALPASHQHGGSQQDFPPQESSNHSGNPTPQQNQPSISQHSNQQQSVGKGPAPLALGSRRVNPPQSAPRQYHRLVGDYETTAHSYYTAKSQNNQHDLLPLATQLETVSHHIWTLRHEHAQEFEGADTAHMQSLTSWQAEYHKWADTVLDLKEGHSTPAGGPGEFLASAPQSNSLHHPGQAGQQIPQGMIPPTGQLSQPGQSQQPSLYPQGLPPASLGQSGQAPYGGQQFQTTGQNQLPLNGQQPQHEAYLHSGQASMQPSQQQQPTTQNSQQSYGQNIQPNQPGMQQLGQSGIQQPQFPSNQQFQPGQMQKQGPSPQQGQPPMYNRQ